MHLIFLADWVMGRKGGKEKRGCNLDFSPSAVWKIQPVAYPWLTSLVGNVITESAVVNRIVWSSCAAEWFFPEDIHYFLKKHIYLH